LVVVVPLLLVLVASVCSTLRLTRTRSKNASDVRVHRCTRVSLRVQRAVKRE
jgi:hypothetical protein